MNEEDIRVAREWCSKATKYATELLEKIVFELDRVEDMIRASSHQEQFDLIDEFDSISYDRVPENQQQSGPSVPAAYTEQNLILDAAALLQLKSPTTASAPSSPPLPPHAYPSLGAILQEEDSLILYPSSPSSSREDMNRFWFWSDNLFTLS